MCYSATASFATAAFLIPTGIYTTYIAYKKHPTYIFLALIPLFFAFQQLMEGMIWLSISQPNLPFHVLGTF